MSKVTQRDSVKLITSTRYHRPRIIQNTVQSSYLKDKINTVLIHQFVVSMSKRLFFIACCRSKGGMSTDNTANRGPALDSELLPFALMITAVKLFFKCEPKADNSPEAVR